MKKIRTRYAPSPTGFLHIGGARTAIFNYLFAKHHQGEFILRFEDTDIERNVEGGEQSQYDNLLWLGLIFDESPFNPNPKYGPYRQIEKLDIYKKLIDQLIQENKAYKAYDTPEEIEQQKEEQRSKGKFSFRYDKNWLKISDEEKAKRDQEKQYTIRLKLKENFKYQWNDIVRGPICFNTNDIGDFIIQKQNGYPTYNFAVVVDDKQMEITHILRGEEHIANTPKQMALYDAFDWEVPEFGHLTIITNIEGKKISKRDTQVLQLIEDYKVQGFIPESIFNFLSILGWTHPESLEIMSKEKLIKDFDAKRLVKSPSKFDLQKLIWFSKEYMKKIPNQELMKKLVWNEKQNDDWKELFLNIYKQDCANFNDLENILEEYKNPKLIQEESEKENIVVKTFYKHLQEKEFSIENIKNSIEITKKETGLNGKNLFLPIRKATTYKEHGPELATAIFLFGEKVIKERIK